MSASDLRKELKELRKSHPDHLPVSKMKKHDVSSLIERMKMRSETIPSVALDKQETRQPVVKREPKEKVVMEKVVKEKVVKPVKEKKGTEKILEVIDEIDKDEKKSAVKDRMMKVRAMRKTKA